MYWKICIWYKFKVRPTFDDDEEIVATFTKYEEVTEQIKNLERQLKYL